MSELIEFGTSPSDQAAVCKHILIVDDEQQIRELLSAYLQKQGYRVAAWLDKQ